MTREQLRHGLDLFDQLDRLQDLIGRVQNEAGLSADEQVFIVKNINAAVDRTKENIDAV